ncbi:hypothetical protein AAG607_13770 [Citromicrobium bathyomarinum]|uniref:hypothetical protein n=1 Tax=Citromicrobium bathyomarinum TaxID=72174 RepID=UPI00315A8126
MDALSAKLAAQDARRETLARLRCKRALTDAERAEEELLERRLAGRVWRRQQADIEARLSQKLQGENA